jgi:hypothetical protein
MLKALEAREVRHGEDLLGQLGELQEKALRILDRAEASNDLRGALLAIREARGCLELGAKLRGELIERHAHLHARQSLPEDVARELNENLRSLRELQEAWRDRSPVLLKGEEALPPSARNAPPPGRREEPPPRAPPERAPAEETGLRVSQGARGNLRRSPMSSSTLERVPLPHSPGASKSLKVG